MAQFRVLIFAAVLLHGAAPAAESGSGGEGTSDTGARLDSLERELARLRTRLDAQQAGQDAIDIGGSVWLNWDNLTYDPGSRQAGGEFRFDLFRFDIEGSRGPWQFDLQYRWYQYMDVIHNAWIGYRTSPRDQWQLGISQVPFGLQPYASHSYWFGVPYYVGLEDDYDTGLKYVHRSKPLTLQLAFYKSSEYGTTPTAGRYSFDLLGAGGLPGSPGYSAATETNQVNARLAWRFAPDSATELELGVSGQLGAQSGDAALGKGRNNAWVVHARQKLGAWTVEGEYGRYDYTPEVASGVPDERVTMGAFVFPFEVAARGELKVFNITRDFDVDWGPVSGLRCYSDYSVIDKRVPGWRDSELHTLGCSIDAGAVFTYVDVIRARNHHFLGTPADTAFAQGLPSADWKTRFNINVEFYF